MVQSVYTGPLARIVGFHFEGGHTLTITGGTDVDVSFAALTEFFVTNPTDPNDIVNLTVRVTGDVLRLLWGAAWLFFPNLSTFKLVNLSTISGRAGAGGNSGQLGVNGGNGSDGSAGGNAIEFDGYTVSIDNSGGGIFGGGGGGGGGGLSLGNSSATSNDTASAIVSGGGGGGGRGSNNAAGGAGIISNTDPDIRAQATVETPANGQTALLNTLGTITDSPWTETISVLSTGGSAGSSPSLGAGGAGSVITGSVSATGGAGGNGGDWGEAGQNGGNGDTDASTSPTEGTGGTGGAAGKAVNLSGGTVNWLAGNEPSRVKGAVS